MSRTALATIHLGALRRNLARVRERAGAAKVMAVVKADGYGHGLERVARALDDADAFGVAALGDGLRLRAAGIDKRVVVLSGPDEAADIAEFRRLGLDAVIHHEAQLRWLEADQCAAPTNAHPLCVWLKIDTGMHRLGFTPESAAEIHARLRALPNVDNDIVLMTHFAASDEFDSPVTPAQIAAFDAATQTLTGARALANSAGVLGWPQARNDWVRVGGLLYGLSVIAGKTGVDLGFEAAMTLSTKLISVNRIQRGERVGYAGTYTCPEDMPVGVAAIGYGDGYPRSAPSGTPVLVDGQLAAIIGRVSMDLIAVDLRHVPNAQVGDRVELWGTNLPVEEIAARAGTISYDLTCGVTRRVLFVEDEALIMAKPKTAYVCNQCGAEYNKWQGQCEACGAWNTLSEIVLERAQAGAVKRSGYAGAAPAKIMALIDVAAEAEVRTRIGIGELDRVLGGGLVQGSVVLVGGDPGIGKSTLLLQVLGALGARLKSLYVSGEESLAQISARAQRLGLPLEPLRCLAETCIERIIENAQRDSSICSGDRFYPDDLDRNA